LGRSSSNSCQTLIETVQGTILGDDEEETNVSSRAGRSGAKPAPSYDSLSTGLPLVRDSLPTIRRCLSRPEYADKIAWLLGASHGLTLSRDLFVPVSVWSPGGDARRAYGDVWTLQLSKARRGASRPLNYRRNCAPKSLLVQGEARKHHRVSIPVRHWRPGNFARRN